MMSKRLSTFLHMHIIKFAGIASVLGMLSGCMFFGSDYPYVLLIDNKLTTPITYSYCQQIENCSEAIQGGSYNFEPYISRGSKPSDKEIEESFDRLYIIICERPIDFKRIRTVSPLVKHNWDSFEIVIDKKVVDTFCQKDS